jgi:hypothetical protein
VREEKFVKKGDVYFYGFSAVFMLFAATMLGLLFAYAFYYGTSTGVVLDLGGWLSFIGVWILIAFMVVFAATHWRDALQVSKGIVVRNEGISIYGESFKWSDIEEVYSNPHETYITTVLSRPVDGGIVRHIEKIKAWTESDYEILKSAGVIVRGGTYHLKCKKCNASISSTTPFCENCASEFGILEDGSEENSDTVEHQYSHFHVGVALPLLILFGTLSFLLYLTVRSTAVCLGAVLLLAGVLYAPVFLVHRSLPHFVVLGGESIVLKYKYGVRKIRHIGWQEVSTCIPKKSGKGMWMIITTKGESIPLRLPDDFSKKLLSRLRLKNPHANVDTD